MNKNYRDQDYLDKVGSQIAKIRKKNNISQERLAELAQLEVRQIGRIERAESNTNISLIKLIATALRVNVSEILDV